MDCKSTEAARRKMRQTGIRKDQGKAHRVAPSLTGPPYLQRNCGHIKRWSMVRGDVTAFIVAAAIQIILATLERMASNENYYQKRDQCTCIHTKGVWGGVGVARRGIYIVRMTRNKPKGMPSKTK